MEVPIIMCDARIRTSGRDVLVSLIEHAIWTYQRDATRVPAR
jgi:hypothetical protein